MLLFLEDKKRSVKNLWSDTVRTCFSPLLCFSLPISFLTSESRKETRIAQGDIRDHALGSSNEGLNWDLVSWFNIVGGQSDHGAGMGEEVRGRRLPTLTCFVKRFYINVFISVYYLHEGSCLQIFVLFAHIH